MRNWLGCLLIAACTSTTPATPGTARVADSGSRPATTQVSLERREVIADDGFKLVMWRKAPANAKQAVLLVHGATWSARPDFDLQVPGEQRSFMDALVAEGYAAYAIDLRGYGATPRDATGFLTPDRAAADVAAALKTIGGKPVLFGWSKGSLSSQLAAQRTPELMSAVVLFGYPFPAEGPAIAERPDPEAPARRPTTAKAAAEDFIAPGVISPRAIEAYVAAALAADPVKTDWRREHQWNALAPEQVHVPVLLLQAELDPLAKTASHASLFARLGTADRQWVVIPKGDHAALLEDTAPRMIAAIRAFVERP